MHYVYLLRSVEHPDQTYVGYTTDLRARLATHNAGEARHTSKFIPWRLVTYLAFRLGIEAMKPGVPLAAGLTTLQWACIAGLVYYARDIRRWTAPPSLEVPS